MSSPSVSVAWNYVARPADARALFVVDAPSHADARHEQFFGGFHEPRFSLSVNIQAPL